MLIAYLQRDKYVERREIDFADEDELKQAIWIDLINPSDLEEKAVERALGIDIPTKNEMEGIEPSDRLYKEDGVLFMTASMVEKSESTNPRTDAVGFILLKDKLVTVRYIDPFSFDLYSNRLLRAHRNFDPMEILVGMLEATVDRCADILEKISYTLDDYSYEVFNANNHGIKKGPINYKSFLKHIGFNGDLGTKMRESLISFTRLVSFLKQNAITELTPDILARIKSIKKDIVALSDHTNFIANKVTFLLSATLGLVNIEQNDTIKIFSVAAVIFLPPTLIASIYGMNFKFIPELSWYFGYPFAIFLMLISVYLPYRFFKKRNWL